MVHRCPAWGIATYRDDPVFRAAFDAVAQAMDGAGVPDLVALMHAPDLQDRLASPLVAQPLLFGFQVAQARSLLAAGLLTQDQLTELRAIFPNFDALVEADAPAASAIPFLKGRESRTLAARHAKNDRPLYA